MIGKLAPFVRGPEKFEHGFLIVHGVGQMRAVTGPLAIILSA
jgi:hypothetical protein